MSLPIVYTALGEYAEVYFLYNGHSCVMTDKNGLYYMRARYYNPEIRRFINQDILTGSIENSQSLNRYAYCQGNPVNYLDPFGLEPCEFFTGLGHGMLNLMGLIPGIGDVFDITNAIWYASEGNWGRCFEAGIAALPFIGNLLPDRRTCDYVRRALNIASYGGTGFLAGQGMIDGGQALWSEINSGQCSGWNIFLGIANIGLNGATLFFSGKGFVQETGNLNKMLRADGVYDGLLGPLKDNGGYLNFDTFKNSEKSKLQEVLDLADNYNLSDDTFNNHILDRHGPNSIYSNKSHFNADFDILNGIDNTLKGDNFILSSNTNGRSGYIFEQTFNTSIGVSNNGKLLHTIKVVIDEAGNVITAFPKK